MTYSLDVINLAITHLITKKPKKEIASILKITRPTLNLWITKYSDNILNMEQVTQKSSNMLHKNNKINKYLKPVKLYVDANIGCSLNDIHEHINKDISKSSICNILKQLNITRKRINNHIVCKDLVQIENERTLFVNNLKFNINDAIYIDESSFCVNETVNYGYSDKGKEINKIIRHKHNKERYTLLAAISNSQIVSSKIIKESVNSEIYLDFIKTNKCKNISFKNSKRICIT